MNKFSTKGLIMTAVVFLSTALSTIPKNNIEWIILGLVFLGTMIGYVSQSTLLPSTSVQGDLNLRDYYKAILISVGTTLSSLGAAAITQTEINWGEIAKNIVLLTSAYLIKQANTPAPKTP